MTVARPQPLRVLVVDDEPPIRLLCRVNLEAEGMTVIEAADGEEALAVAAVEPPEVVLLDVMLPGIDGWQVAERLREQATTREVPIVFVTAATRGAAERARAYGGVYVPKPFNPIELPQVVRLAARGG